MTVLHRYTHNGTDAATVTTGNSGYASTVGAGTAAKYSAAAPALGSADILFASGASSAWQLEATDAGAYNSFFIKLVGTPGATMQIARARTSGGGSLLATIRVNTSRQLVLTDGSSTTKATSTTALTAGTWYQVLWNVPGDGTQTLRIYNQAGSSLLETLTPGASSASAGTCADHTIGQNSASSDSWHCDHHRVANAALSPIKAPTAAFSASVTNNLAISTSNTSAANTGDGETLTYDWDWGDGGSHSTTQNPTHTYASSSTYTIVLTVTDTDGATASVSHNISVVANVGPTAAFSSDATELSVDFTDESTDSDGTIASWAWDFGDSAGTSTDQSPTYEYTDDGTYTVTLTVTDDDGATDDVSHDVDVAAASDYVPFPQTLTASLNRLAGTTGLAEVGAANAWAGTVGLDLVGALNVKAGNTFGEYLELQGVLNQLAGTTGLAVDGAASQIAE